ncbi:ATP synthase F1 subunit epsilon [bacterium]|nr:MAG: ATP synthase F1 subunit epsilon [bacterium]
MAHKLFKVDIVTPEKTIYSGTGFSLVVPSESGYLGILADHAPLIANLVSGKITLKKSSKESLDIEIKTKGLVEVLDNKVTLLIDNSY